MISAFPNDSVAVVMVFFLVADIDFLRQVTKTPFSRLPQLSDSVTEFHVHCSQREALLVVVLPVISYDRYNLQTTTLRTKAASKYKSEKERQPLGSNPQEPHCDLFV